MKFYKPSFWSRKIGFVSLLLYPFSLVYLFIIFIKKIIIKKKIFKVPIICVGNIYLGGTGKTPLSILLGNELLKKGKKVAILRKFYESHKDEHALIKNEFENLILNKNRVKGIEEAERLNYDFVILDDGLQDYRIKKNLSIVCFHGNQLIGNGLTIPSGPLREKLNSLQNVEVVLINGKENKDFENKILKINSNLEIFYSTYQPINLDEFENKKIIALAGIGNPENFFELIQKNKINIQKKIIFPDHHVFSKKEIENIVAEAKKTNSEIIMTKKDYFKFKEFTDEKINYLKISLKIHNQIKLLDRIMKLNDKNY